VFNRVQWEGIVQHAVGPVVLTVVIQAALLAAGILLLVDQTEIVVDPLIPNERNAAVEDA
jgi:hypothetical protein